MKALSFILLTSLLLVKTGFAQQKVIDKIVIKTPAAICEACKDKIEAIIGREYGVNSVRVDIKKRTTTIVYITDRTNDENLKTALSNLGFDADDVPAEETAIKRLPKCCQKIIPVADSTVSKPN